MSESASLPSVQSVVGWLTQCRTLIILLAATQLVYDLLTPGRLRLADPPSTLDAWVAFLWLSVLVIFAWRGSAAPYRTLIATALILQVAYDAWTTLSGRISVVTDWIVLVDALWLAGALWLYPRQDDLS